MSGTRLTVYEQEDPDGDMLYAVSIVTHSWSALRRLEELFDVLLVRARDLGRDDAADAVSNKSREDLSIARKRRGQ